MESKQIRLGSVTLLCTFVMVCVAVLTVLSIVTARADWQLTRHSAQVTTQWYELQNEGQLWLSRLDQAVRAEGWEAAQLPEGSLREGQSITTTLERGGRTLTIQVEKAPEVSRRPWRLTRWRGSAEWDEEEGELRLYSEGDLP